MSFLLYNITGESGREQYRFVRGIQLAGQSGPLATYSRSLNAEKRIPLKWHATSKKIIQALGGSPADQAIVFDLKPRATGKVSLYRLLDVWGFSYADWTPLALRFRVLFADRKEANPFTFRNSFTDPGTDHSLVGEFLYVRGGVSQGTWNWGKGGRVKGTLLWIDALDYLGTALKQSI
jgi:hypothetical protein